MKRKHKQYSKPKRPFDKARIDEEFVIKQDYGLKNKKEIWKADANVRSMRQKAKKLIKATPQEQQDLFDRLKKIGLKVDSIADVLGLDKKDYLERRLQTIVKNKGIATTMKTARQMIVHKKILVDGAVISSPSYIVPTKVEKTIELKKVKKVKPVKIEETPVEEIVEVADDSNTEAEGTQEGAPSNTEAEGKK